MSQPKVHNKHHHSAPADAVYIGRGSIWGNPFVIGEHGNRDEVCAKYERYLKNNSALLHKAEHDLKGKHLVCFCAPLKCHGDFLLSIANKESSNGVARHG